MQHWGVAISRTPRVWVGEVARGSAYSSPNASQEQSFSPRSSNCWGAAGITLLLFVHCWSKGLCFAGVAMLLRLQGAPPPTLSWEDWLDSEKVDHGNCIPARSSVMETESFITSRCCPHGWSFGYNVGRLWHRWADSRERWRIALTEHFTMFYDTLSSCVCVWGGGVITTTPCKISLYRSSKKKKMGQLFCLC